MYFKHNLSVLVLGATLFVLLTDSVEAQVTETEPNDTFVTRNFIPSGPTTVIGELSSSIAFYFSDSLSAGEVDFFAIADLKPSASFFAFTDNTASGVDTILGSFDDTNALVDYNDDSSPTGNGLASGLGGFVNADGTINLGVTGFLDYDFEGEHSQSGEYDLAVTVGGDVDFFNFSDLTSQGFRAEVISTELDTVLGVFAEGGTLIESNNSGNIISGIVPDSNGLNLAVTGSPDFSFEKEHFQTGSYALSFDTFSASPTRPNPLIVNNGFEAEFTGWKTIGQTTTENFAFASSRGTEGLYQAFLSTGEDAAPVSSLESFLGLEANSLNKLSEGEPIEGSAVRQEFTAQAGDLLTFDFNFLTDESTSNSYNDFAFVSVTSLSEVADTHFQTINSRSRFEEETSFNTFSLTSLLQEPLR